MYLSNITIENFRCFGEGPNRFELSLKSGLTALVGENDVGKTAVVDALRFILGTTDQEWYRLDDSDFQGENTSLGIKIVCRFEGLSESDQRSFLEYLTYKKEKPGDPLLLINWTAKDVGDSRRGKQYRRIEVHSGKDGAGPALSPEARELLRATYLRPLRDAEQALSAGRGSRLSQILHNTTNIQKGDAFDPEIDIASINPKTLNVLGIGDLANALIEKQEGVVETRTKIDEHLGSLSLHGKSLNSDIKVSGAIASDKVRLQQLLEKLDLELGGSGKVGLGSNNLLFIACELLLLAEETEGLKLLLIEEPEAHLHTQRQLRMMRFLEKQAEENQIQILVTTHSPNLASAIRLSNLVTIQSGKAFSLAEGKTNLQRSDYRFLERFLDVTKANLFFARGVMIVEGDAENILLPTVAKIMQRDFTEHGVSIVNVGGVGLRRYARIFQREDTSTEGELDIPVACVTDMDVMPNCAPVILHKIEEGAPWPPTGKRRWRAKKDFSDSDLSALRDGKRQKASGQCVKTFVSDEWTLEYDLALGSKDDKGEFHAELAEDVYIAACLAENDDAINSETLKLEDVSAQAKTDFASLKSATVINGGCSIQEVLAAHVYSRYAAKSIKAIAAQYLAEILWIKYEKGHLTSNSLRRSLPRYVVEAIDYVTRAPEETNVANKPPNE